MAKLFKLKEWLTLSEAARHLSLVFDEEVSTADILRLVLDRKLQLSVNFVNYAKVQVGKFVRTQDAEAWAEHGFYLHKPFEPRARPAKTYTLPLTAEQQEDLRQSREPYVPLQLGQGESIVLDDGATLIQGVWDLAMIGNERLNVEQVYQELTHGPAVTIKCHDGVFLKGDDGQVCRLYEVSKDLSIPFLSVGTASDLPEDLTFVVRTTYLNEFVAMINGSTTDRTQPEGDRSHMSDKLIRLNQASKKFWGNADRNDRATHPNNVEVVVWLKKEAGFSETLADKGATIIRPEWAPVGRKPEE